MAIEIRAEELSPAEYFRITPDLLPDDGGTDSLQLFWMSVPACRLRLVLAIPPKRYCWGMQFWHAAALADWEARTIKDSATAAAFAAMFSGLGLDPDRVSETLAGCSYFGEEQRLTIGTQVADLPRAWFRAKILPDGPRPFEDFVRRLRAHIDQLGKFFLLPRPEGSIHDEVSAWAETVDRNLELLFGSDHGASLWDGGLAQRRIEALEEAIREVSRAHAETWLTPRFLEWDLARPTYPMAETPIWVSKRTRPLLSMFSARSPEELHRERMTLSLLRVKLLRKWRWPVGVTLLRKHHESRDFREFALKSLPPWPALEAEVTELLSEATKAYPVLFE